MYMGKQPLQNPAQWIEQTYGPVYSCSKQTTIADYPLLGMNFFPDEKDHCALVALTSVFRLYAERGYSYLPADEERLFYRIRRLARQRFMLFPRGPFWQGGTVPFALSALARAVWRFYGYRHGRAANRTYMFSGLRGAAALMAAIGEGQPVLLSLSSGYYCKHTVTVYGYEVWTRTMTGDRTARPADLPEQLVFLRVNDHWTDKARYVLLNSLDPAFGGPFFMLTFIRPPADDKRPD